METADIDHKSALLIARIQLEDTLEIERGRKGKARIDADLSDEEVAFNLQASELRSWQHGFQDFALAKSLSDALEQDAEILDAYRVMEEAAVADRRAAEAASRGRALPPAIESQKRLESIDFCLEGAANNTGTRETVPRQMVPIGDVESSGPGGEGSMKSVWRFDDMVASLKQVGPSVDRVKRDQCVSCDTKLQATDLVQTICHHSWCITCLNSLIEVYVRDESLHPLRCCKNPFSLGDIDARIDDTAVLSRFREKRREYEVPAQNRVYCASSQCSKFLGSSEAQPIGQPDIKCPLCRAVTCSTCRNFSHTGVECKGNEAVEQLRTLARAEGWQTCPGCFTVVDLHHGCNHMTCHCHAEFCFVCGVRWKNCECPQWDETRLVQAAEMRAQNDLGERVRIAEPARFAQAVRSVAERIRYYHDCDPHRWRGTGPGDCEECGDYLPVYLKMCIDCNLAVCRRCSYNRM